MVSEVIIPDLTKTSNTLPLMRRHVSISEGDFQRSNSLRISRRRFSIDTAVGHISPTFSQMEVKNENEPELPFNNVQDFELTLLFQPDKKEPSENLHDSETAVKLEVIASEGYRPTYYTDEYGNEEMYALTCLICFSDVREQIMCCPECETYVCFECVQNHVQTKVLEGVVVIFCPGDSCSKVLPEQIISAFTPADVQAIYIKNKVELENDPNKKTCPGCHKVEQKPAKRKEAKNKIHCMNCEMDWCFSCHAPWHKNITCNQFQKDVFGSGQIALKYWAKSKGKADSSHARRCPSCKFYIERISGCDHMTCNKCKTDFCYKCGKKHRKIKFLGDHFSTYSFLGCKYNLAPKKPVLRFTVRSGVVVAFVVLGPPVAALGVTAFVCATPYLLLKYVKNNCCW